MKLEKVMRFFVWYVAIILAAYAISASWSLGLAAERLSASEQQAAQLSAELDAAQTKTMALEHQDSCSSQPQSCAIDFHW